MAAKSGDKKIVEQLVEKEADIINIKDDKKVLARPHKINCLFLTQRQYLHNQHQVDSHFCI